MSREHRREVQEIARREETEAIKDPKEQLEKQKEIGENKVTDPKGRHGFKRRPVRGQGLPSAQEDEHQKFSPELMTDDNGAGLKCQKTNN